MTLPFSGTVVDDRRALMELGALEVSSTHPDTYPLHPFKKAENDDIPEVLTVQVQTGEIQSRTSHVPAYISEKGESRRREKKEGEKRRGE